MVFGSTMRSKSGAGARMSAAAYPLEHHAVLGERDLPGGVLHRLVRVLGPVCEVIDLLTVDRERHS
jgi:hypothetical protein